MASANYVSNLETNMDGLEVASRTGNSADHRSTCSSSRSSVVSEIATEAALDGERTRTHRITWRSIISEKTPPSPYRSINGKKTRFFEGGWQNENVRRLAPRPVTVILVVIIIILMSVLISTNVHLRRLIPHNDVQRMIASWGNPHTITASQSHYPTDFSRDITPIPCHSHNDYLRRVPLYDALAAGCTSIEADVWLDHNNLLVGHTAGSLTHARSLKSLYIDPLINILTHQNNHSTILSNNKTNSIPHGVFDTNTSTSLTLLIDIKTAGPATFAAVQAQLEPLRSRGWLTYFNGSAIIPGPITVVGSGNTPFDFITKNTTYRDIFYDAPLDAFFGESAPKNTTLYTKENSYYASVSFSKAVGKLWKGTLRPEQVRVIQGQVEAARERGLKARYWDTPAWPVGRREHVWDVLVREGVGILGVDDLEGVKKRKW